MAVIVGYRGMDERRKHPRKKKRTKKKGEKKGKTKNKESRPETSIHTWKGATPDNRRENSTGPLIIL
jgi:hypothetical protein